MLKRPRPDHGPMKNHVYKLVELTGTSQTSMEDAVNTAIQRAGQTIKNLRWFQVVEIRGDLNENKVAHWQVTLKIGFTVDDPSE
jgi:flavin-binding protein dodecin